jgi:hypothetical protein
VLIISHKARRLLVRPVTSNPGKGMGQSSSREGACFLGCDKCVGNEGSWTSCSSRHLGMGNSIEFDTVVCR